MGHSIGDHAYGECGIEFLLVDRAGTRQRVRRFRADVRLLMDHPEVYRDGDNTRLIPVSSISNSVLAIGAQHAASEPESYALALAERFLSATTRVRTADVRLTSSEFSPLLSDPPTTPAQHFSAPARHQDHVHLTLPRHGEPAVRSGLLNMELFATGGATFTGFARDAYTTTQAVTDRVFGARMNVTWRHAGTGTDHRQCRARAEQAVVKAFGEHTSRSSQHTFHHLGAAVLDACPEVAEVRVEGAHLTRGLVDLAPFGVANESRVYTATDHQQSTVTVTIHRTAPENQGPRKGTV
ncbi:hypothetical protein GO001_22370 [Streptomyces sp. NRRL B-1677]|uniref:Uricase n=1 Tax=Streptomyces klenkii TaxID=1420899 RepID=A0A3B0AZL2_9ACTN|nr:MULTISPECIES: hypothetical protein [Streptomyces]MBF6047939.1 hypothetical protein [Streptomyces sp. NRRL B-1677]RKN65985.1 hypothetical protein D7231_24680 [Streptomyces klenkii]